MSHEISAASLNTRKVVQTVIGTPTRDGAGVSLTRVIGTPALPGLDPFLLLDEFASDRPDDYIGGFPDHPHRGFETVTYMLAGRMRHADNQGNQGLLDAGSVQWMTAGRGIVHSEMPEQRDGLLRGFQLWVNLPARDKLCEPRYQDIPPDAVPRLAPAPGVELRLIAGRFGERSGPVSAVAAEPLYYDLRLDAGAAVDVPLPVGHSAFAYVYDGEVAVADAVLQRGQLGVLSDGDALALRSDAGGALLLIAGQPFAEPVARYGPFVMNTEQEIRDAISDYQAGRL